MTWLKWVTKENGPSQLCGENDSNQMTCLINEKLSYGFFDTENGSLRKLLICCWYRCWCYCGCNANCAIYLHTPKKPKIIWLNDKKLCCWKPGIAPKDVIIWWSKHTEMQTIGEKTSRIGTVFLHTELTRSYITIVKY